MTSNNTTGIPSKNGVPLFHEDDWKMLLDFKRTLAGYTATAGETYTALTARVGARASFLSSMMHTNFVTTLSRCQQWAQIFGLLLELNVDNVTFKMSEDVVMLQKLAARPHEHLYQRMLLNKQLIGAREKQGMSLQDLAQAMGRGPESVRIMEASTDWPVATLLTRTRALGGVLQFELLAQE